MQDKCDRRDCKYFNLCFEKIPSGKYYPAVCVQCTWLNRNFDNYEERE